MRIKANEHSLRISLPSDVSLLERTVEECESFFRARLDSDDLVYTLMLLASEAVTNGIEHGNAQDASKLVRLTATISDAEVQITVEDEGPGFTRNAVANPLTGENLMASGGRGLLLMETIADEVKYEKGGRLVRVILSRKPGGG